MGKTILSPTQSHFLQLASAEPAITAKFYFTGGTALAEFYLHHRYSEDIDLFCDTEEVDQSAVEAFLKKSSPTLGIVHIKRAQMLGLYSYTLVYGDGEELKVDFNYYPFPRIAPGTKYQNLAVDSLYDIAVNKVHSMFMRARSRDFIDLYFIFKKTNYSLDKLIIDAKAKFDWHIDPVGLASQFLRVSEAKDLPKMLLPFRPQDMEDFYLDLAKSLKDKIFKPQTS